MVKLCINKEKVEIISANNYKEIVQHVSDTTNLCPTDFYLEQNGKHLLEEIDKACPVYVRLRIFGGKGGFGSMLRAIGAQIEKTTNREACRDLSGRRLRDINEEKRLKAWLEKQGEREREAEERKKRKIEKLLAVPKHEFKDSEYEQARSKLTEKVCDAVEEGFKKASTSAADLKRKNESSASQQLAKAKKKRPGLWLDDLSSDDSDDSVDSVESEKDKKFKNKDDSDDSVNSVESEKEENKALETSITMEESYKPTDNEVSPVDKTNDSENSIENETFNKNCQNDNNKLSENESNALESKRDFVATK